MSEYICIKILTPANVRICNCMEFCITILTHLNIQIVFTIMNECLNVFVQKKLDQNNCLNIMASK